jgi:spermidine synthase
MRRLDLAVFLSGAALMGLEIVGSRVLAPVFGTSIFVWGALITTFLASLAAGYALGGRFADRHPEPRLLADILVASGALLWILFAVPHVVLDACAVAPVPDRFRALLASLALFAPPSVLMGAVTPFAVRLAARELATVGSAAGRLSAISTAGSILGTFATAFFLIPAFATRPILFGLGLSLVAAAVLVPAAFTGRRLVRDGLVTAAGCAMYLFGTSAAPSPVPDGRVVFEKETAYHHIRVVDQGRQRMLFFNNRMQNAASVVAGGAPPASASDGLCLALLFRRTPPRSAVMIGLGAGVVPAILSERMPEIATTSIEIDPEVVAVAEKFFGFRADANDRVLVGDGRRELEREVAGTDIVFVDAFFADSVPFHLLTREFYALCRSRLSGEGVFVANFAGPFSGKNNALFWAAVKSLQEEFPRVYVFSSELASGKPAFTTNTMLLATRSPDRLDRATIAERGQAVAQRLGRPAVAAWAGWLYDGEMKTKDVPALTDAYSPTDALQHLAR